MTSGMPSARATSAPCSGPAPPNATSAKPRGSSPFCTVRELIAFAMLALTIVRMPSAASSRPRPSCSARPADGAPRGSGVEPHRAAEKIFGIEPAEHEIGVGHGRLGAAPAIGGRARVGAGAARADAKGAAAVDIGDRAAAGADRVDVDHRRQHRIAADPGVAGGRLGKTPVDDDADIGRGAADIEGDQPIASGQRAAPGAAEDARSRPREQGQHRALRDGRRGRDAAIGAHHVQIGGEAFAGRGCRRAARRSRAAAARQRR